MSKPFDFAVEGDLAQVRRDGPKFTAPGVLTAGHNIGNQPGGFSPPYPRHLQRVVTSRGHTTDNENPQISQTRSAQILNFCVTAQVTGTFLLWQSDLDQQNLGLTKCQSPLA